MAATGPASRARNAAKSSGSRFGWRPHDPAHQAAAGRDGDVKTLYWHGYVLWTRLACRWFGWHRWGVRIGHGYAVTWCSRRYAHKIELLPDVEP